MAVAPGGGYWLTAANGSVFNLGGSHFYGSAVDRKLAQPVEAIAAAAGAGYWLVAGNGSVFNYGAPFYGSAVNVKLSGPVIGIVATPDGHGYWLVTSTGTVLSYGDARPYGSAEDHQLSSPVVATAATRDGRGYWLVTSSGTVLSYGDAGSYGSARLGQLSGPVIGMAPTEDGRGYWLVERDGATLSFGDAVVPTTTTSTSTTTTSTTTTTTSTSTTTTTTTSPPSGGSGGGSGSGSPGAGAPSGPSPPSTPELGVLEADPSFMSTDQQAGVSLATLNLDWAEWEPNEGVFNQGYVNAVVGAANAYRAAGWQVAVDVGLQQPPAWAFALPQGQLTDQFGYNASTADFEFSEAVRDAATAYINDVVQSMGMVVDYRVGLSENGEAYYPDTFDNGWWAFTPDAQGTAAGLPSGVGVTPMPGWIPGTTSWQGSPVSESQVTNWYAWYFGALVNATTWEIDTYRSAGYDGQLELVMPGMGSLPAFYNERLQDDLAPGSEDSFSTLNTGAVWWLLLQDLGASTLANTAIDVSSVYDNSGTPQGNDCQASDASVNIDSSQIWSWSDTRYLAYLANQYSLLIMGETPGDTTASQLPGLASLVVSCHLTAIQWAWDYTLNGSGGVTPAAFAAAIDAAG